MSVCAVVAATICMSSFAASVRWQDIPGLQGPGHAGIHPGDFDGDGAPEAAVSAFARPGFGSSGSDLLTVFSIRSDGGRVRQATVFPGERFVGPLRPAPGQGAADRLVAVLGESASASTASSRIVFLGGVPLGILRSIPAPGLVSITDVADIDGDGALEILGLTATSSWSDRFPVVLDHATGHVEWTGSSPGRDVRAVQLDADAPLELVLAAAPGRILDGASHAVEWTWPAGFGEQILIGRFADATTSTFATLSMWGGIVQIFRGQPFTPIREVSVGQVGAASVVRLGGADQIGIGDGQWGSVSVLDPRNGSILFTTQNPQHGVSSLAGGDLDGDGRVELIYGSGLTSSGADILRVVDTGTGLDDFYQVDEVGPHVAVARGKVSGTTVDEVAYLTTASRSGYDGPNLHILDAETGRRLRSRENIVMAWGDIGPLLAMAQLDGDPQLELVVATSYLYTPRLLVIDGATLADEWSVDFDNDDYITSLETMDVTGDEIEEVIVTYGTGLSRVIGSATGPPIWQSVTIPGTLEPLSTAFRSSNGAPYVLVARDRGVYLFDIKTGFASAVTKLPVATVALTRWGDGSHCEIGLLGEDDVLRSLRCFDLVVESARPLPAETSFVRAVDGTGERFVVASGGRLHLSSGNTTSVVSEWLGDELGYRNLGIVTSEPAGSIDVIVGAQHMIARLSLPDDPIFTDGFD